MLFFIDLFAVKFSLTNLSIIFLYQITRHAATFVFVQPVIVPEKDDSDHYKWSKHLISLLYPKVFWITSSHQYGLH